MLIGNVGKDPEVRYLDQNSASGANSKVATFTVATTEKYRDRNGELHETTEWHNIVAWRGYADTVEKYVKKGSQVYVEGRLRTRSWNDQSGNKRYTTEIIVDTLQLLGRRQDNPGQQSQGGSSAQGGYSSPYQGYSTPKPSAPAAAPVQPPVDDASDDLPF